MAPSHFDFYRGKNRRLIWIFPINTWSLINAFLFYSEHVKGFDGNGTEVFAVHEWDPVYYNKSFQYIPFGESENTTIQVSLVNNRSYVIIDYGILRQRLNLGK